MESCDANPVRASRGSSGRPSAFPVAYKLSPGPISLRRGAKSLAFKFHYQGLVSPRGCHGMIESSPRTLVGVHAIHLPRLMWKLRPDPLLPSHAEERLPRLRGVHTFSTAEGIIRGVGATRVLK